MTILATYTKLCALNAASSGIVTAPTAIPPALFEGDLPCCLTKVGPSGWNEQAVGLYRQTRTYYIDCFVKSVGEGLSPDDGYQACLAPLYALGRTYVTNPTLDNTVDHIGDNGEFTDGGLTMLEYAGTKYHGFRVTLEITEKAT